MPDLPTWTKGIAEVTQAELDAETAARQAHAALADTAHGGLASQAELDAHAAAAGLGTHVPAAGLTDAHIAAAAAIAKSKLAPLAIVNADVDAAAAIAKAKLAPLAIVNADVDAAAAIAKAKLAPLAIVNADVDAAAAIAKAKLAPLAIVNADVDAAAAIAYAKLALADALKHSDMAKDANGLAVGAFHAFLQTTDQSIPNDTATAVIFNAEKFDISNWYDVANGRFTPQVRGVYRLSAHVNLSALGSGKVAWAEIWKNGARYCALAWSSSGGTTVGPGGSALVDANGTTDYFQIFIRHDHGAARNVTASGDAYTNFQGELVGRLT